MAKAKLKAAGDTAANGVSDKEGQELVKVQVGPVGAAGVDILGHPCKDGMVIELPEDLIALHRERGVALLDVPEDYDGEVYDVHEPYVNPEHESA